MRRHAAVLASVGWLLGGVSLGACGSSGAPAGASDSGAVDGTTHHSGKDAGHHDARAHDAGAEGAADGGAADATCTPVDAGSFMDAQIQAGKSIALTHKCALCHGGQLQGNGVGVPSKTAEGGIAYPPDLTPDPVNGLGCWTNAQVEGAFLHGIDDEGSPLCAPMPHFGEIADGGIDEAGALDLLAYLRSLPIIVNPTPNTPNCPMPVDAGVDAHSIDAGHSDAGLHDGAAHDAPPPSDAPVTDALGDGKRG